jgi:DNA-directed RNA polymerase specialized sigma24 family protein
VRDGNKGSLTIAKSSFGEFYGIYRDAVLRFARHQAGPDTNAENIAVEAWIQVCDSWDRITDPRPWVYRVIIDLASQAEKERQMTAVSGDPYTDHRGGPRRASGASLYDIERIIDTTKGLQRLPRLQRAAVLLNHCGWPASEIAEVLGCRNVTAWIYLHLGRSRLRKFLAEPAIVAQEAPQAGLEGRTA